MYLDLYSLNYVVREFKCSYFNLPNGCFIWSTWRSRAAVLKAWSRAHWGSLIARLELFFIIIQRIQIQKIFPFSLFIFQLYNFLETTLHVIKRLNAEADMWIQLPSITPDIKKIGKNVKQCHSSNFFCLFWELFSLKMLFI